MAPLSRGAVAVSAAMAATLAHAQPISIVYEYASLPGLRSNFVNHVQTSLAGQLAAWKANGVVSDYELRTSTLAAGAAWDALSYLYFDDTSVLSGQWKPTEASYPGGLSTDGLGLGAVSASYVATNTSVSSPTRPANPTLNSTASVSSYTVLNYSVFDNFTSQYLAPLYGFFLTAGAISRYEVYANSLATAGGVGWGALLVLEFVDTAALASEAATMAAAQAALSNDPVWAAWAAAAPSVWTATSVVLADWVPTQPAAPYASLPSLSSIQSTPAGDVTLGLILAPLGVVVLVAVVVKLVERWRRQGTAHAAATPAWKSYA